MSTVLRLLQKTFRAPLWTVLVFAFVSTGCQKKLRPVDEHKQVLRLNIHTEPPTLDSRKAIDTSSISIINMCFEGLLKRSRDGNIKPAIAHKVEISSDGKVYTFSLRQAKWWDGRQVTAHDFEQTWKTVLDPNFPSGFAHDLYVIKNGEEVKNGILPLSKLGVKALNDSTLRVELKNPIPYFLDLVSCHCFFAVPSHVVDSHPKWAHNSGALFVGNGPYKLGKWRHHNCITLVKNPHYWDQEFVKLDEIQLTIIEDQTTELNMFESEELDWAGSPLSSLPTDAIQALAEENRLHTYSLAGTYYYIFNVDHPPFNNLNFRKAFTLAINRKTIIENILQAKQITATSFIPPSIWTPASYFQDNDIEEARRLFAIGLEEMEYTLKTLPPITLIYNTSEAHHKIAQAIQEQWFRAFGIRVRLSNREWKVFLDELSHKQFQIARMGGIASFKDPLTFFDLYKYPKSNRNYSGWGNPAFTELIERAEVTSDPKERELYLRKAEEIFMQELPIAPVYYYTGSYIKKDYVKGIELTDLSDIDVKFAFLETQ